MYTANNFNNSSKSMWNMHQDQIHGMLANTREVVRLCTHNVKLTLDTCLCEEKECS